MAKIISMINWKGGVGKSTLTLHLGLGLMLQNEDRPKVLLIDLDPQCNLSYLALGVTKYVDYVYKKTSQHLRIFLMIILKAKNSTHERQF
ncbi:TPA: ParA family protein [Salmonella enterica subsp. enterica serovar 1,4,[5],12:b:-]